MEITGRLTADATVRTVSGARKVVSFSIAINDSYRSGGETKRITTFFDCSYWMNAGIAEYLKKGGWVQLYGRVGVNAYMSGNNEAKASLTFHTSEVKLLGSAGDTNGSVNTNHNNKAGRAGAGSNQRKAETKAAVETEKAAKVESVDPFDGIDGDLPF